MISHIEPKVKRKFPKYVVLTQNDTYEIRTLDTTKFRFVYSITHKETGKSYIGRKNFVTSKGNDAKWKSYTSSSKSLNADIKTMGKNSFDFIILSVHEDNMSLGLAEIEKQIELHVLDAKLLDGSKAFYNQTINYVKFNTTGRKRPENEIDQMRNRMVGRKLKDHMSEEAYSKHIEQSSKRMSEYNKTLLGVSFEDQYGEEIAAVRKKQCGNLLRGKTYDDVYGKERAEEIRSKRSKTLMGYGTGIDYVSRMGAEVAAEAKRKKSNAMKKTLELRRTRVFELIIWFWVARSNPTYLDHLRPLAAILDDCSAYLEC